MSLSDVYKCLYSLNKNLKIKTNNYSILYYFNNWYHPIMSYNIPNKKDVFINKKKYIDNAESIAKKNPFELDSLYFNVISKNKAIDNFGKKLAKHYNLEINECYDNINILQDVRHYNNLPPAQAVIYNKFNSRAKEDYFELFKSSSKMSRSNAKFIFQGIEKSSLPIVTILKNSRNKVIGGGAVFTRNSHAYLFGAEVLPKYRNKGYWKYLLNLRQQLSYNLGARTWALCTNSKHLINTFDEQYYNHALIKQK